MNATPEPIDLSNIDFHEIARRGDTEVMDVLLRAGVDPDLRDTRGYSLLMIASYNDQEPMVTRLLAAGASVDAPDAAGNSPLMGVCFKGYPHIARRLLSHGANPNARNHAGATPLMLTAMFAQREIADDLLTSGADAAAVDPQGRTASDFARFNGHVELANFLAAEEGVGLREDRRGP